MIQIETIYKMVNNDLARKDWSGHTSTDEFNRVTNLIQGLLFDFYIEKNDARSREALRPFIEPVLIERNSSDGSYNLPADYRQRIELGLEFITSSCGSEPTFEYRSAHHLDIDEDLLYSESAIMQDDYRYEILSSTIIVKPSTFQGRIKLKYYKNPPDAFRGFTLNTTTLEEVYSSGTTTNLIWPESEISNFVDLHLLFKGLSVRQTELVQFAAMKQQFELKTAMNND
jgi:hypothetical protein